jgi:hypothetical protein
VSAKGHRGYVCNQRSLNVRALVSLDEDLGRHARNKMNIRHAGDFVCRQRNANRVIGLCPADYALTTTATCTLPLADAQELS